MKKQLLISSLLFLSISFFLTGETFQFDLSKELSSLQNDPQAGWPWRNKDDPKNSPLNLEHALELERRLGAQVLGQEEAVRTTAESIIRFAAGINDPNAPIASFLFIGPTGVGKTELAKALSKELFGGSQGLLRLNMAEFSEEWTISRLIGSSPGYIDSWKGGQLTEPLLENPYRIVLLDEIDKAHPKVQKVFLQVLDEGEITSSMGKSVDCRKAIFILTSNYAAEHILTLKELGLENRQILFEIEPLIMQAMAPELYNRLNPVIFSGLSQEALESLVYKMLNELKERVYQKKGISLSFDESLIFYLKEIGYHPTLGARPLKRLIEKDLTTLIAKSILNGQAKKGDELFLSYAENSLFVELKKP